MHLPRRAGWQAAAGSGAGWLRTQAPASAALQARAKHAAAVQPATSRGLAAAHPNVSVSTWSPLSCCWLRRAASTTSRQSRVLPLPPPSGASASAGRALLANPLGDRLLQAPLLPRRSCAAASSGVGQAGWGGACCLALVLPPPPLPSSISRSRRLRSRCSLLLLLPPCSSSLAYASCGRADCHRCCFCCCCCCCRGGWHTSWGHVAVSVAAGAADPAAAGTLLVLVAAAPCPARRANSGWPRRIGPCVGWGTGAAQGFGARVVLAGGAVRLQTRLSLSGQSGRTALAAGAPRA